MTELTDDPTAHGSSSHSHTRPYRSRRRPILLLLGLFLLSLVAISRFAGHHARWIDVVGIYSWLVMWPLIALAIVAAFRRHFIIAALTFIVAGIAAAPMPGLLWWMRDTPVASFDVRVLVCNVQNDRDAVSRLGDTIQRERPDLVVVIEMHEANADLLLDADGLADLYPYSSVPGDGLNWPVVILSRWELEPVHFRGDDQRYRKLYAWRRAFRVNTESSAGSFLVTAIHAPSPRTDHTWEMGHDAIRLLGEIVRDHLRPLNLPIVIAGDFNTAPGGFRYQLMADQTGLQPDNPAGPPVGTWPSRLPGVLRVALDHVWTSPDAPIASREVLEDVGSDHRPILVTLLPGYP